MEMIEKLDIVEQIEEFSELQPLSGGELDTTYVVATTSARCDCQGAISMVNEYCQQLPHDEWTSVAPQYTINSRLGMMECTFVLPFAVPLTDRRVAVRCRASTDRKSTRLNSSH